ncbi:MAG TPA: right-handed parallel beta-helix repeat-containing protein [Bryobacteraceae bacterium]|nr:right-handed parallel beta-helix repeat-containing protein [Bryobacteraceae bacterium]
MKKLRFTLNLLALAVLTLAFTSVASAQATRTWVSGVGDDANPCSRTAPCKTFAGAISKTATNGIIDCLDPGGFGAVTITKSIMIDCDSGPGGVLVSGTNGIVITGGAMTVTLRSLNIDGIGGSGVNGILINNSGQVIVHIIDVNIVGFGQNGISVATSANAFITVRDTQIHDNTQAGISTTTSAGVVAGDFDHVALWDNLGGGMNAGVNSHNLIHNSNISLNAIGINQSGAGAVLISDSVMSLNTTALQSAAGGTLGTTNTTYLGNGTVFFSNGGQISTGGDNANFQNGALGLANGPAITKI